MLYLLRPSRLPFALPLYGGPGPAVGRLHRFTVALDDGQVFLQSLRCTLGLHLLSAQRFHHRRDARDGNRETVQLLVHLQQCQRDFVCLLLLLLLQPQNGLLDRVLNGCFLKLKAPKHVFLKNTVSGKLQKTHRAKLGCTPVRGVAAWCHARGHRAATP